MGTTRQTERRLTRRERTSLRVRVTPLMRRDCSRWGCIADVSRAGALVEGIAHVDPGEPVLLRISSPVLPAPLRVRAQVARRAADTAGLRFIDVCPDVAADLEQVVGRAADARYHGAWDALGQLRAGLSAS